MADGRQAFVREEGKFKQTRETKTRYSDKGTISKVQK